MFTNYKIQRHLTKLGDIGMLQEVKSLGSHAGCVICIICKLILKPFVIAAGWLDKKTETKPSA